MDVPAKIDGVFMIDALVLSLNRYGVANKVSVVGSHGIQLPRRKLGLALGLQLFIARGYAVKYVGVIVQFGW